MLWVTAAGLALAALAGVYVAGYKAGNTAAKLDERNADVKQLIEGIEASRRAGAEYEKQASIVAADTVNESVSVLWTETGDSGAQSPTSPDSGGPDGSEA